MKCRLKFVKTAAEDFKNLKKDGFGGIIFPACLANSENLEMARKNGLKRLVHIGDMSKIACEYLDGADISGAKFLPLLRKPSKRR